MHLFFLFTLYFGYFCKIVRRVEVGMRPTLVKVTREGKREPDPFFFFVNVKNFSFVVARVRGAGLFVTRMLFR